MESQSDLLLQVRDLKTHFFLYEGVVKAVDGVSFDITRGRTLGVIGESGCGKSVTAQSIMRLVPEPPGKIIEGEILLHVAGPAGQLDALLGPHRALDAHDPHPRRLRAPVGHDQGRRQVVDFEEGEAGWRHGGGQGGGRNEVGVLS